MQVHWTVFAVSIFAATAVWDLMLRGLVEFSKNSFPTVFPAIQDRHGQVFSVMAPYFKKRSVLSAMLFAGLAGLMAIVIVLVISQLVDGRYGFSPRKRLAYLGWIALVSAVVGLGMKYTNYAPPLAQTYYSQPVWMTFLLDGLSGILVAAPVLLVITPRDPPFDDKV